MTHQCLLRFCGRWVPSLLCIITYWCKEHQLNLVLFTSSPSLQWTLFLQDYLQQIFRKGIAMWHLYQLRNNCQEESFIFEWPTVAKFRLGMFTTVDVTNCVQQPSQKWKFHIFILLQLSSIQIRNQETSTRSSLINKITTKLTIMSLKSTKMKFTLNDQATTLTKRKLCISIFFQL